MVDPILIEMVLKLVVVAVFEGLIHRDRLVTFLLVIVFMHAILVTVDDVLGDVRCVDVGVHVALRLVESSLLSGLTSELGEGASMFHQLHQVELNGWKRCVLRV